MKTAIITCFESNEQRMSFVYDVFVKLGHEVIAYTTDFSHIKKAYRNNVPEIYRTIHTKSYAKNMSVSRILSHMNFSKEVFKRVEADEVDLIWLMAPANSLIKEANRFRKKHPNVKLILDIIDMWPESLPVKINKNILPFRIWKNIRQKNLVCADLLVSECDMYQEVLSQDYDGKMKTIYLAQDIKHDKKHNYDNEKLSLCYIGSINNIIDIDLMVKTVSKIEDNVVVHVIGEGESTEELLKKMSEVSEVIYHGPIRDEKEKAMIFDQCHAGLNIYREGLYIGLTTKCLDYFANGLPIINNIKGDTWKMVEEYGVGFNIDESTVLDVQKIIDLRNNDQKVYELYDEKFTRKSFDTAVREAVNEVMK